MLLRLDWCHAGVKDANLTLLDVVCVADIDSKERVDDSLVGILKLVFGKDFEHEYLSRYWKWSFVKTLKLNFG